MSRQVLVAVDGGGSKTDVAVVDVVTGEVVGTSRGAGCSHHQIGIEATVVVLDEAVTAALADAAAAPSDVVHAGCYLTAIDLESEQVAMHGALSRLPWAARSLVVDNDVFALLRAGTEALDAAVVVCGTGINGVAVRADGATARVLALGQISGDWGGASGLAEEVLWHAARAACQRTSSARPLAPPQSPEICPRASTRAVAPSARTATPLIPVPHTTTAASRASVPARRSANTSLSTTSERAAQGSRDSAPCIATCSDSRSIAVR